MPAVGSQLGSRFSQPGAFSLGVVGASAPNVVTGSGGISQAAPSFSAVGVERFISSGAFAQAAPALYGTAIEKFRASGGITVHSSFSGVAFEPYGMLPPARTLVVTRDNRVLIVSRDLRLVVGGG